MNHKIALLFEGTQHFAMRTLFFIAFYAVPLLLSAQFFDDFSAGLHNWRGDTALFSITPDYRLQLDGGDSSRAVLLREVHQMDTLLWYGRIALDFQPSNANRLVIHLIMEAGPLTEGYILSLGETGRDDALRLIKTEQGTERPLIALHHPSFGDEKLEFEYSLGYKRDTWTLSLYFPNGDTVTQSITDTLMIPQSFLFALDCRFTATRSDRFYFDDLGVGRLPVDTTPPVLTEVQPIDNRMVLLKYSEKLDTQVLPLVWIHPKLGVQSVIHLGDSSLLLTLSSSIKNALTYRVEVQGTADYYGNVMPADTGYFKYIQIDDAQPYDLIITEIMADPSPPKALPDCEYVEIYNNSDKYFDLSDYTLADAGRQVFLPDSIMAPGQYLVFVDESCADLFEGFANIVPVSDLPSLNNDGDHLSLVDFAGRLIHEVAYEKSWYGDAARSEGGWSLEMIDKRDLCRAAKNWKAADFHRCGSPGAVNSVRDEDRQLKAPRLVSIAATSERTIVLEFDQRISELASLVAISPSLGQVYSRVDDARMTVYVEKELQAGQPYLVVIDSVRNCQEKSFELGISDWVYLPIRPDSGEVLVNEVLFNPHTGGSDFLEIHNPTSQFFKVENLCVQVMTEDTIYECSGQRLVMAPESYIAITKDSQGLKSFYNCGRQFYLLDLPSIPDDGGELRLFHFSGGRQYMLDRAIVREDWHSKALKDANGVSLERRRSDVPATAAYSWHSASEYVGFATPGLVNSQQFIEDSTEASWLSVPHDAFSPNGDGHKDLLNITIHPDKSGYNLRLDVVDLSGRVVQRIADNALTGRQQHYYWDGYSADHHPQPVGIYILVAELAHPDGDLLRFKGSIVLN